MPVRANNESHREHVDAIGMGYRSAGVKYYRGVPMMGLCKPLNSLQGRLGRDDDDWSVAGYVLYNPLIDAANGAPARPKVDDYGLACTYRGYRTV